MGVSTSTFLSDADMDAGLYHAACTGDAAGVARYINDAANVNHREKDEGNATPLIAAAQEGLDDVVALLLHSPVCDVRIRDEWGLTACHYAARWGHKSTLGLILSAGADVSVRSEDGSTAAHFAAERGHSAALAVLLDAGADPYACTAAGLSVKDLAQRARCGHVIERRLAALAAAKEELAPSATTELKPLMSEEVV